MATYAIGDVQGCADPLERLLDRIAFDPERDRLWFAGDLVNRGPDSLAVLRRVKALGPSAITVLGNHDLHLLARARGLRDPRPRDTFDDLMGADDRDELLAWLASRPLIHRENGWLLVHAGLLPHWTVELAERHARKLESRLAAGELAALYGGSTLPASWPDCETESDRERLALAAMTRLRMCSPAGAPIWEFSGPPAEGPADAVAWFDLPGLRRGVDRVLFGHWAALGLHRGEHAVGLDSGCVWGQSLTAVRLDDLEVFQQPCPRA